MSTALEPFLKHCLRRDYQLDASYSLNRKGLREGRYCSPPHSFSKLALVNKDLLHSVHQTQRQPNSDSMTLLWLIFYGPLQHGVRSHSEILFQTHLTEVIN